MESVLIVGNVIKDIYLALDEKQNHFERDAAGTSWLDLAFDGRTQPYLKRTAIFTGAATSLEVLHHFQLPATIAGQKIRFKQGEILLGDQQKPCNCYRYILSYNDQPTYFTHYQPTPTSWQPPTTAVDWIFIDYSANLTPELTKQIINYLSISPQTRLAICLKTKSASSEPSKSELELIKLSSLIFSDGLIPKAPHSEIYYLNTNQIKYQNHLEPLNSPNFKLVTPLTTFSILAATIFSALLQKKTPAEALLFAKLNLEHSTLSGTLTLTQLEELVVSHHLHRQNLELIAKTLMTPGKGILAADESGGSIHQKFLAVGIPDDAKHRRDYRNIFFTTPELAKYASGVILFDETAHQLADDGRNFVSFLTGRGIIPGIKVDQGLANFSASEYNLEKYTKGLDGLSQRLEGYYELGIRFAKWRAAFEIRLDHQSASKLKTPTAFAIHENIQILARYAKACQVAGLVPIVEPEVVYDGDYPQSICAKVTGQVLTATIEALRQHYVNLAATIIKCNMVMSGKRHNQPSSPVEVGVATAKVLKDSLPPALAGVVFLSGGQTPTQATANLQAIIAQGPYPWPVSFSFARALQESALMAWQGNNLNILEARAAFAARLAANAAVLKK